MAEEASQGRSIKVKPSILRKAYHRAIESQKRLGQWLEEAIDKKTREKKNSQNRKDPPQTGLSKVIR